MFVPILVYHAIAPHHAGQDEVQAAYTVAPEAFEAQMAYLKEHGYNVVSFTALVDAIERGKPLPERSVVITFDDGRTNQFVHAFPVLKKYGFTATFFVYPNPVGRKADFMSWDQLKELQAAGMTIGSHTQTHPFLTKVTNPKLMKWELEGSRANLEKHLGGHIEFFAYPFGLKNPEVISLVQRAGYRAARAFPGGTWQGQRNLYSLKGLQVRDNMKAFAKMLDRPAPAKSVHP